MNKTTDPKTLHDVAADHTAKDERKPGAPLPPGPPEADDVDFIAPGEKQSPGYRGVPGAGPNPTA